MGRNSRKRFQSNKRIYDEFPADHPARRYLIEFGELRREVCGREIDWPDCPGIDQAWYSPLLQRNFSFSSFAYSFISYTLLLDEWFDEQFQDCLSGAERGRIEYHFFWNALLSECEVAAAVEGNDPILQFIALTRANLDLGIAATAYRLNTTSEELLRQWGEEPVAAAKRFLASEGR